MLYLRQNRAVFREEVVEVAAYEAVADERLADTLGTFHCLTTTDTDHTDGDRALHHSMLSERGAHGGMDVGTRKSQHT